MLIDAVTITVKAGHGGRGAVAFNTVKMALGPTGGSGAKGGNVFLEAVADIGALRRFRTKKLFQAPRGEDGRGQFRDGHRGEDLILLVPRGSVITNKETGHVWELTRLGERALVAEGGNGGKGNFQYRSPTNTSPKQSQPGLPGQEYELHIELKLIADVGLVGFPNVGKSSFLNEFTNAKSRVANYAFTTLEPNLGAYFDLIIADIPGLIEGASIGKGLGIKFLRHIERTRVLFHFIDANTENPLADYKTVRHELAAYNKALSEKREYIIISKADAVSSERLAEITKKLQSLKKEIIPVSIYDPDRIIPIKKILDNLAREIKVTVPLGA